MARIVDENLLVVCDEGDCRAAPQIEMVRSSEAVWSAPGLKVTWTSSSSATLEIKGQRYDVVLSHPWLEPETAARGVVGSWEATDRGVARKGELVPGLWRRGNLFADCDLSRPVTLFWRAGDAASSDLVAEGEKVWLAANVRRCDIEDGQGSYRTVTEVLSDHRPRTPAPTKEESKH